MSDLIISPVKIDKILPHPHADRLEIIRIGGWQVVASKGQHTEGETVLYVPPDALVPKQWADAWGVTSYLSWKTEEAGRVKAAKLRQAVSYGFIAPNDTGAMVGTDLTAHYGITKYETPVKEGTQSGQLSRENSLFHKYTDIQNLRNHIRHLDYSQELVVTEKLHGCVPYNTNINMADGSKKRIIDIKIGDLILGKDENGNVVPAKVLNVFNNGKAKEWMSFEGKRYSAGRGNHYFSVKCTPNHKIWSQNQQKYIEAENLQIGDVVSLIRSDLSVTPIQEQILIGKMLGDGSLSQHKDTASITFTHKKKHEKYLHWVMRGLGNIAGNQQKDQLSGYGTKMCRGRTISSSIIKKLFSEWINSGEKQVPASIIQKVGPIALAFWYMDDGSLAHHKNQEDRASFAICGFNNQSTMYLQDMLLKYDIKAESYKSDNSKYNRLRLNAIEAEKFFLLIAPYVPKVMQYKLPERYRGHDGWIPEKESQFKPTIVNQTINKINRNISCESSRYDIETETHNYFANGVLIHNCNSRVGFARNADSNGFELCVGSHHRQYKVDCAGLWDLPYRKYKEALDGIFGEFLHDQEEFNTQINSVIFFGEIFGPKIQDLTYGKEQDWRLFDIAVDGEYVSHNEFELLTKLFPIPTVPKFEVKQYTYEELEILAEGESVLCPGQIKEGVVIKPVVESTWSMGDLDPDPKRMIFKLIGSQYLLRKNGTEFH